jgi:hypothetical protein
MIAIPQLRMAKLLSFMDDAAKPGGSHDVSRVFCVGAAINRKMSRSGAARKLVFGGPAFALRSTQERDIRR